MAGDWIKMRCELVRDPDVIQIAAALGVDEFGVVGRLHSLWSWLDAHSADGTNVRIVSAFLDRLTACPGFADALRTVGWLDGRDGNLTFPGYAAHNGESAKARASGAKRKQKQRKQRDICPSENGTHVPKSPGPEKRREEKNNTPTPLQIRLGKLLNRRESTKWDKKELAALKGIGTPEEEDLQLLEAFYFAVIPEERDYRRRKMITLLTNWNGEVDKARAYKLENPSLF